MVVGAFSSPCQCPEEARFVRQLAPWYHCPVKARLLALYHLGMPRSSSGPAEVDIAQRTSTAPPGPKAGEEIFAGPEIQAALKRLEMARERLLSAAIAFCDGSISAGQLKAVREFLREQDLQLTRLTGRQIPPFALEQPPIEPRPVPEAPPPPPQAQSREEPSPAGPIDPEIGVQLESLDRKLGVLEENYTLGRINATQYKAIRHHYSEQREVALKLHAANPASDRWRVVLEEGRTVFLMQLNEAACRGFALYDIQTRARIFLEGTMGKTAEEAMTLLGTFCPPAAGGSAGRMLATRTEDGMSLLLIPGQHTAALMTFSQDPPGWQVRTLREVHRNFEAANHATLARGERTTLVFPDVSRIVKPQDRGEEASVL